MSNKTLVAFFAGMLAMGIFFQFFPSANLFGSLDGYCYEQKGETK